jgi:hypothetical protein
VKQKGTMQRPIALTLAFLLASMTAGFAQQEPAQQQPTASPAVASSPSIPDAAKPRVFLQSQSKGTNRNAARDQSMEMSKDFEEVCPGVRVTITQQMADYTVLLNHIEIGLFVRDNQFQVADKNGDLLSKTKEGGSIKGGVKKVCDLIVENWTKTKGSFPAAAAETAPAPIPEPVGPVQAVPAQLAISSNPDGADIEIDGGFVGNTPSSIETTPGEHVVVIHKKGFKDWQRKVKVSGGVISLRADLDAAIQDVNLTRPARQ